MIKNTIIPENLRMIRVKFGNSQYDISKVLKLSIAQYSKKEKGTAPFSLVEAKLLADYYKLSIEDIFFRNIVHTKETNSLAM